MDIDRKDSQAVHDAKNWLLNNKLLDAQSRTIFYKTKNGWHGIAYHKYSFRQLCVLMPHIPNLDQRWFEIGKERGYWFLISYQPLISTPDFPLSYMRISWNGKGGVEWVEKKLQRNWIDFGKGKTSSQRSII